MTVSVRAIRETYRFAEAARAQPHTEALRLSKVSFRTQTKSQEAVIAQLSGRRESSRPGGDVKEVEKAGAVLEGKSAGALAGLFAEVRDLGERLNAIQSDLDAEPQGSARHQALQEELLHQQQAYDQLLSGPTYQRLQSLFERMDQALARGVSREDLARLLGGERALLGDNFLGVLQQGDVSGLLQVRGRLGELSGLDIGAPGVGFALQKIGEDGLQALAGKSYQKEKSVEVATTSKLGPAPQPVLEKIKIDMPGNVSFALNTITGKDIARAIEAHRIPDPRYALTLILDDGDKETSEKEKQRIEEQRRAKEQKSPFNRAYPHQPIRALDSDDQRARAESAG